MTQLRTGILPYCLLTWDESDKYKQGQKTLPKEVFPKLNVVGTGLPKGLKYSTNIGEVWKFLKEQYKNII